MIGGRFVSLKINLHIELLRLAYLRSSVIQGNTVYIGSKRIAYSVKLHAAREDEILVSPQSL